MSDSPPDELTIIEHARDVARAIQSEIAKQVIGQHHVIEHLLFCLLSGGHALLVGVPGLAKTLLVRTLAQATHLNFRRIQFTPDLMPADITGTEIIDEDQATGHRRFVFVEGPLFANIILADEINRTPPKTQSALLEAMQEHSVTVAGKTYTLTEPFFVLATQNPIEQEGTYPLPEAQLDRFMFNILLDYPTMEEEVDILETTTTGDIPHITPVATGDEIVSFQQTIRRIPVPRAVQEYTVRLIQATRPTIPNPIAEVKRFVRWGSGPRASQQIIFASKVRAVLQNRYHVEIEDIQSLAAPILRHRILLNYHAEAEHFTPDALIAQLISKIQ